MRKPYRLKFLDKLHPWQILSTLKYPYRWLDSITLAHHGYLDRVIASITQNPIVFGGGFFSNGWGDISKLETFQNELVEWSSNSANSNKIKMPHMKVAQVMAYSKNATLVDVEFESQCGDIVPEQSKTCYAQLVIPAAWDERHVLHPFECIAQQENAKIVVILPGTGEQGYIHRRNTLALPLAEKGIACMVLEGPYYGKRRPPLQMGTKLRHVMDLPILGKATLFDAMGLLAYCKSQLKCKNLSIVGSSMGGLHAAMVGSLNPFAVGVVAWMAPPSAIPAFIDGLLASSCDWKTLSSDEKYQLVQEMVEISNMKNGCVQELLSKFLDITNIREEKYYQTPIDPSLATIMLAQHDEYIGSVRHEWEALCTRWKGATIESLPVGHVSGILFENQTYRDTIEKTVQSVQNRICN